MQQTAERATLRKKAMPSPAATKAGLASVVTTLARGRDEDAWSDLLRCSGNDILQIARGILRDHALAEDAAQETLLRIRDSAGKFIVPPGADADSSARSWIMRITCTTSLQMLRSRRRSRAREQNYGESRGGGGESGGGDGGGGGDGNDETLERVRKQLEMLPDDQRLPLVLHFMGGMEYAQLAAQLGCPAATARTRVHRGLKSLRERLAIAGMMVPVADMGGLLQRLSSGSGSLDAGHLSGWQPLLQSPRKPLAVDPPRVPRGSAQGGLSFMAKVGITTLALSVGAACYLTMGPVKSEEARTPPKTVNIPAKAATKPVVAPKDGPATPKQVEADTRRKLAENCTIQMTNVPLKDILSSLGEVSDLRIVLADDAKDAASRQTSLSIENQPLKTALDKIAAAEQLSWRVQDGAVAVGKKAVDGSPAEDSDIQVLLAKHVSFEFVDTELSEAIDFLHRLTTAKFTFEERVVQEGTLKTPITLRVQDMEMSLALKWMLRLAELDHKIKDGGILIGKKFNVPTPAEVVAKLAELKVETQDRPAADVITELARMPNSNLSATTDALIVMKTINLKLGKADGKTVFHELLKDPRLSATTNDMNLTIDAREVPAWENEIRRRMQRLVTFEFADTPLDEAIAFMRSLSNVTVIVDPHVLAGEKVPMINLAVTNTQLGQAMSQILTKAGLSAVFKDQAIYIAATENLLTPVDLTQRPPADFVPTADVKASVKSNAKDPAPAAPAPEKSSEF